MRKPKARELKVLMQFGALSPIAIKRKSSWPFCTIMYGIVDNCRELLLTWKEYGQQICQIDWKNIKTKARRGNKKKSVFRRPECATIKKPSATQSSRRSGHNPNRNENNESGCASKRKQFRATISKSQLNSGSFLVSSVRILDMTTLTGVINFKEFVG